MTSKSPLVVESYLSHAFIHDLSCKIFSPALCTELMTTFQPSHHLECKFNLLVQNNIYFLTVYVFKRRILSQPWVTTVDRTPLSMECIIGTVDGRGDSSQTDSMRLLVYIVRCTCICSILWYICEIWIFFLWQDRQMDKQKATKGQKWNVAH